MTIIQYAMGMEQCFENFLQSVGKQRKTTFFSDLSIAECYDIDSIKETYRDVMCSWGDNLEFMCEWVICLNQKICQHYENNEPLARVYDELWRKADDYCRKHFKGEELRKYYEYID